MSSIDGGNVMSETNRRRQNVEQRNMSLWLEEELHRKLRIRAAEEDMTKSAWVRALIEQELSGTKKPTK